jgi:hypothetical protein
MGYLEMFYLDLVIRSTEMGERFELSGVGVAV